MQRFVSWLVTRLVSRLELEATWKYIVALNLLIEQLFLVEFTFYSIMVLIYLDFKTKNSFNYYQIRCLLIDIVDDNLIY